MINRYKMENPKEDKLDRTSNLKEQVSRIYMNTIAANEREDRLLSKKLDAIDMEHRAQFLRMKKIIRDARSFSSKRLQILSAERQRIYENKKCHTAPADSSRTYRNSNVSGEHCSHLEQVCSQGVEGMQGLSPSREQTRLVPSEAERDELSGRLQYTEKEVNRMRKSWVGQNTAPTRKRTFLPHLEKQPDIKGPAIKGEIGDNNTRISHRGSCQPQLIKGGKGEACLPEITANSLPKNLERRTTLNGNHASTLRAMKRESAALSRSLPSSF